jgi:hypothetical protein
MSVITIISGIIGMTALLVFLYITNEKDKKELEQTLNHPDLSGEFRNRKDDERRS